MLMEPRLFSMTRLADESGVSGAGRIADGAVFHNGQTALCWRTDIIVGGHGHTSLGIYPSFETFKFIHVDSHPDNLTELRWLDTGELI